ncbi:hypothetical protein EUGRSUZ_K02473 [Eucalyptus grandis]|uniref:Uncharacterized protein n=2 Tax=Eucalyptus grandis TaxID=71139 RepID=A0A059A4V4_EUCGR|nr:hypothetical protein EUGRSUZ_K02473 [Eucalyptus grandis]
MHEMTFGIFKLSNPCNATPQNQDFWFLVLDNIMVPPLYAFLPFFALHSIFGFALPRPYSLCKTKYHRLITIDQVDYILSKMKIRTEPHKSYMFRGTFTCRI